MRAKPSVATGSASSVLVRRMVFGFDDKERQDAVREVARAVEQTETENKRMTDVLSFIRDNGMTMTKELIVHMANHGLPNVAVSEPTRISTVVPWCRG